MTALKVRKMGGSLGVIFPKDLLVDMHVVEGDELFATAGPDGIQISPYDPEFDMKVRAFSRTRRKFRNALRELAK